MLSLKIYLFSMLIIASSLICIVVLRWGFMKTRASELGQKGEKSLPPNGVLPLAKGELDSIHAAVGLALGAAILVALNFTLFHFLMNFF